MKPRIAMVVGSLRKGSFNRQLAREVEAMIGGRAEVSYVVWSDLPYLNQDLEVPEPTAVARVRAEIQEADGVWVCSPEYNGNIPGGMKNFFDWLSRPKDTDDLTNPTVVEGKPVALCGAGGKLATAGMRSNLADVLTFMKMRVVAGAGTGIAISSESWGAGQLTLSDRDRERLRAEVDEFLDALRG